MANYEHLPVFKSGYELLIFSYRVTKDFPKEYKYTIGEQIKKEILDLIIALQKINSLADFGDRKEILKEVILSGEKVKLLYRVCRDLTIILDKHFSKSVELSVNLLKQLEGWKKSLK